jgi:hypothetical protein
MGYNVRDLDGRGGPEDPPPPPAADRGAMKMGWSKEASLSRVEQEQLTDADGELAEIEKYKLEISGEKSAPNKVIH